jgi:integrase
MKLKLDAKTVVALALPKGKAEDFAWDAELENFGLRLRRRAAGGLLRNWVTQYRANGHTRRVTIGSADKISPAQARDAARKLLARVELGHDPQAEREAKRQQQARTVGAVIPDYLATRQTELRPASLRVAKIYLTGSYFKPLQTMAVSSVTRADVAGCIRSIARKHSLPTAAAARRQLSAFFSWTIAEGLLGNGANPVAGSHRPKDSAARDRVLDDSELVAVWKACSDNQFGRIVRLLILLGARRQEIGGMTWDEIELEGGTWTLPKERSKNRRSHTLSLPPAALEILKSVPRTSREHVFGDRASTGFVGWSYAKTELDRRLGDTVKPWHLHDIRRTVATRMADIGIEPHVIEICLNHHGGHRAGVAGIYNRSNYANAMKTALARWDAHVGDLIAGRKADNVVALQRA